METQFERDRRWFERVSVTGAAAVLEFGFLGIVFELEDLSLGGARLRGPKRPVETSFDVLLHVSNRYLERRARRVWENRAPDGRFGIEFESMDAASFHERPDEENDQQLAQSSTGQIPAPLLNKSAALIIDGDARRAGLLGHSLSTLGVDWISAPTPLDAIEIMVQRDGGIGLVVIAPMVCNHTAEELTALVAAAQPGMRQALMSHGGELIEPWSLASIKMALDYPSRSLARTKSMELSLAVS
jgi:hypothetical protein